MIRCAQTKLVGSYPFLQIGWTIPKYMIGLNIGIGGINIPLFEDFIGIIYLWAGIKNYYRLMDLSH